MRGSHPAGAGSAAGSPDGDWASALTCVVGLLLLGAVIVPAVVVPLALVLLGGGSLGGLSAFAARVRAPASRDGPAEQPRAFD